MPAGSNQSASTNGRGTAGRSEPRRQSLSLVVIAWLFGAAFAHATGGAMLPRWGQLLELSPFGFGLLSALPFAAALIQLPASYFVERFGHYKALFIGAGIAHRATWLAIALIPWLAPPGTGGAALLWLFLLSATAGNATGPIFMAWMAELVPSRLRGRYFSRRYQLGQVVGMAVTLLTAILLDRAAPAGRDVLMKTISAAFAVAAALGIIDFLFFLPVPAPAGRLPDPKLSLWELIRQPLADRNFRRFMGWTASLTFATAYVGQFVWLYLFDVARMSNTQATMLLVFVPLIVMMLSVRVWGRLIDRLGRKPVLVVCGILIVPGAAIWLFITPESWLLPYVGVVLATLAWPGVEIANFNILLAVSEGSGERRYGSAYVAVNSIAVACAGVASGVAGGLLAQLLKDVHWFVMGRTVTYHGILFLLSAALRAAALLWLVRLEDGKALHTRVALRFMAITFYASLNHTLLMPGRLIQRFGRWTYKLGTRNGRRSR